MAAVYDLGDVVSLDFTTSVNSSATDATTVTLTVTLPDGTTATPSVTHVGTGTYSASYTPTQVGRHVTRWLAVGVAPRSHTDVFNVREPASLAIMSLAEARQHLNMDPGDTVDDEELRGYIDAATVIVERHLNKVVARRTVTEFHQFEDYRRKSWAYATEARRLAVRTLTLNAVPVVSITSVATTDGLLTWDVSTLDIDGPLGLVTDSAGRGFNGDIQVVFVAGPSVVPANVLLAAQIIVAHLWQTQRMQTLRAPGLGSAGSFGDDARFGYLGSVGYAIPQRAVELLGGRPPVFG